MKHYKVIRVKHLKSPNPSIDHCDYSKTFNKLGEAKKYLKQEKYGGQHLIVEFNPNIINDQGWIVYLEKRQAGSWRCKDFYTFKLRTQQRH